MHTLSPWINKHWGNGCIDIHSMAFRGPNPCIARVYSLLTSDERDGWKCTEKDVAETESNARLITAAPILLEAAIAAKEYLENGSPVCPGSLAGNELIAAVNKALGVTGGTK